AALAGLIGAWRRRAALGGWALVAWAALLLGGGLWFLPALRGLWLAATLVPMIFAALFLSWRNVPLAALVALGLFWALELTALPPVAELERQNYLLVSGMLALVAALLTSGACLLHNTRGQLSDQQTALADRGSALNAEQGRLERMAQQWSIERDRLATALDLVADGLAVVDADGAIVAANTAANRMWADIDRLEGRQLADWQRENPGRLRILADEREGERRSLLLEQLIGQHAVVRLVTAPVRGTSGEIVGQIALFRNQTAAHELEQMRTQFLDLLVQDMHDPLTSILAAQDTLLAGELPSGSERVLANARRSTTRLLDMVNTLLEMNKLQHDPASLHRFANPLRPLIESSVAQVTPLAQQRAVNLVMEYGADGGPVWFDAEKMRRVMLSLLDNALKHSPAYSTIRVQASQSNGVAQVRITDQGPGIAPEQAERIFERFSPASNDRRSTGLGLAFCKLGIEAHGGRIWVESAPGKGSTFAWSLPAGEAEPK
ncbi:MAG TPA: ATP-binding protein, partial [Herpetosiphonaceae bacterium]